MSSSVFRKASVERVSSPEQLHDYLRVTRPSVWIVLVLSIALLASLLALWSVGKVETTVPVGVVVEGGQVYCYASLEVATQVEEGMTLRVGDKEATVRSVSSLPVKVLDDKVADFVMYCLGDASAPYMYEVGADMVGLGDGIYKGDVVTDEVRPIEFIIGS